MSVLSFFCNYFMYSTSIILYVVILKLIKYEHLILLPFKIHTRNSVFVFLLIF